MTRVVVITGGSSGIGAATARLFAKKGYSLVLSGRNETNLEKVACDCQDAGLRSSQVVRVKADVSCDEDCKQIINSAISHFGRIDSLICSAGILNNSSVQNVDMNLFDITMRINLRSVVYLTSLALPYLKKVKGNIVVVSSFSGIRPTSHVLSYGLSKAALDHFVRISAAELGSLGVRINSVNPGVVDTGMHLKTSAFTQKSYDDLLAAQHQIVPLGRAATAEEVVPAIEFLSSDSASYITGVNLLVDGGRFCFSPRGGMTSKL